MSTSDVQYELDRAADVKSMLITGGFAAGVCDPEKRSTICSHVAAEVARLTQSGRPTISRTCVELTTGAQTVVWRMQPDCSLTVTARIADSWHARSMSARMRG